MNNQETKEAIKTFIKSITSNRIKLIKISSESNEHLSGMLQEGELERNVAINLKSIGTGEANNSDSIIFGHYSIKIEDTMNKTPLALFEAEYRVILSIKSGDDFKHDLTEAQQRIVGIYFNQSGKIILFPYIRHLYDMIVRESDLFLPPLPPILFKH